MCEPGSRPRPFAWIVSSPAPSPAEPKKLTQHQKQDQVSGVHPQSYCGVSTAGASSVVLRRVNCGCILSRTAVCVPYCGASDDAAARFTDGTGCSRNFGYELASGECLYPPQHHCSHRAPAPPRRSKATTPVSQRRTSYRPLRRIRWWCCRARLGRGRLPSHAGPNSRNQRARIVSSTFDGHGVVVAAVFPWQLGVWIARRTIIDAG
jgi:hypothetical protein